jgi:serine protease AprX
MLRYFRVIPLWGLILALTFALPSLGDSDSSSNIPLIRTAEDSSTSLLGIQAAGQADKIAPELRQQFNAAPGSKLPYLVIMAAQADTSNSITDWNSKGRYVLDTLRATANSTQSGVASLLGDLQRNGDVDVFKSYYIINSFSAVGNIGSAEAIAARPEVRSVLSDAPVPQFDEVAVDAPAISPNAIEWNVSLARAPQAWARGYNGSGQTIANLDTGVRYSHLALVGKYRGNLGGGNFDHNYNWWDAIPSGGGICPAPSQFPCDSDGHGTHTTGTMLGDDSGTNQVGVAPGAQWIGSRWIGTGGSQPSHAISGMQWMLAPTNLAGQNPDPTRRPVAVSNSWRITLSYYSNCSTESVGRAAVQNWVNAGIFPDFAAGNSSAATNALPAGYPEAFAVGSLQNTNPPTISSFSSRGPQCFDGGQLPDLMAGGSSVRSATRSGDTAYSVSSGTSMAAPHIAGAVAILKQANASLTVTQTWHILTSTAHFEPSWGVRPNSTYGWGMLDVDAALTAALNQCTPGPDFLITSSSGASIVPGTTQVPGSTCDSCTVNITLPFAYDFYDTNYTSVVASNKGNLQFTGNSSSGANSCLPTPAISNAILAYWDDINTNIDDTMGIYTSTSGSAPNRIFNIEWRGGFVANDSRVNFAVRLYEGQPKFEVIYGATRGGGFSATIGVQEGTGTRHTQYSCDQTNAVPPGTKLTFDRRACAAAKP